MANIVGLAHKRRKRIVLVADFAGHSASQILFEQNCLLGDFTPRQAEGQNAANRAGTGAEAAGGPVAFACNERDEVRNLHDISAAVCAHPGMKQQTFLAENAGCLTPWDTQQARVFTEDSIAPTVTGADGGGGRNPAGLLFCAAFSHKAGAKASGVGYEKERSPTLTSNTPSVLCINDQGGNVMDVSENITGTLRAQMHSHQPLVHTPETYAIAGNIIGRKDKNGGNGMGFQRDVSYTITSTDRHAVYSQQRSDEYTENSVVSTQAARQYKDATDLVCDIAGIDCRSGSENRDLCGTLQAHSGGGYSLNTLHPVRITNLIRRLTPLECERLMNFPGGWTDIPDASDSKRYKALGNSVVVSCMEYVLRGIAYFLNQAKDDEI